MTEEQQLILATAPAFKEGSVAITKEGQELIANTLAASGFVGRVAATEENDRSVACQLDIKRILKEAEELRVALTKPSLDRQREIKTVFDTAMQPLRDELSRLMKLSGDWVQLQEAKKRAEENARKEGLSNLERERQEALSKVSSHEEREAVMAHYGDRMAVELPPTPPLVVAAKGQSAKPDWEIEITDIHLFAKCHPGCVSITHKVSDIKALLRNGVQMDERQGIRVKPILNVGVRLPPTRAAIDV